MIKTDKDIQQEIKQELLWEPTLSESDITVRIHDNVVELQGTVNTLRKKNKAEEVAKKTAGLLTIENNIDVVRNGKATTEDVALEHEVKESIRKNTDINKNWIKVTAHEGWITLEGTVQHADDSDRLRHVAAEVEGVLGVANLIKVAKHEKEEVQPEKEEEKELQTASEKHHEEKINAEKELKDKELALQHQRDLEQKRRERTAADFHKERRERRRQKQDRRQKYLKEKYEGLRGAIFNVTRRIEQAKRFIQRVRERYERKTREAEQVIAQRKNQHEKKDRSKD